MSKTLTIIMAGKPEHQESFCDQLAGTGLIEQAVFGFHANTKGGTGEQVYRDVRAASDAARSWSPKPFERYVANYEPANFHWLMAMHGTHSWQAGMLNEMVDGIERVDRETGLSGAFYFLPMEDRWGTENEDKNISAYAPIAQRQGWVWHHAYPVVGATDGMHPVEAARHHALRIVGRYKKLLAYGKPVTTMLWPSYQLDAVEYYEHIIPMIPGDMGFWINCSHASVATFYAEQIKAMSEPILNTLQREVPV